MKKFDFEISTLLYVFRSPESIYAIFTVMYTCMRACARVCVFVYASEHDSVCIRLSSDLVCTLLVTVGRTLLILMNVACIIFSQEYKKEFLYITLFLRCSSIQTKHSIGLKIHMHIIGHYHTICIDFGKFRINSFFQEYKK